MRSVINRRLDNDLVGELEERFLASDQEYYRLTDFAIAESDFQTIKVQLNALGLITQSIRNRSVKDTDNYWTLTPYGHEIMTRLRAIKRPELINVSLATENPFVKEKSVEEAS